MDMQVETEVLAASFDIVARQDEAEKAITVLRSDVDEVKARLDRVSRAAARPTLSGVSGATPEVKGFTDGYLRRGREVELKSINGATPGEGGYAVPHEIDALIASQLADMSPIRSIAQVVQVGSAGYRKLIATGGTASGWAAETDGRPETATPQFREVAPPSGTLYANPAASQAMLDDAAFDIESWIASEIAGEFARAEGIAFVNGTGVNQPIGFLAQPNSTADDATRPFGTLEYYGSGDAAGLGTDPETTLIDLVHTLKSGYRQGASWVINSTTLAEIRKLKTTDGAFLWQPGLVEGQPDRLLGYSIVEAEAMPDIAAGACPIAFGNFKAGYLIAERTATTILRDPFTNKPFVHFYATRRVAEQSQKEFYVNEAHALTDALLHAACEGETADPPATPAEGETWLVGNSATGEWSGEDGKLASRQADNWLFAAPKDGMRLFDRSTGQILLYRGGWQRPAAPGAPSGGAVVDAEARAAIVNLVVALVEAGIFPSS